MTKKWFLVLIFAAFLTTGAFAQARFGVGGGAHLGFGVPTGDWADGDAPTSFLFGFHLFFDERFAEASIGLAWDTVSESYMRVTMLTLEINLLGKIPIDMGNFSLFPLAGVGLNIPLSDRVSVGSVSVTLSGSDTVLNPSLSLIFGGGADFYVTERAFIRPALLFGLNFKPVGSDWWDDMSTVRSFSTRLRVSAGVRF